MEVVFGLKDLPMKFLTFTNYLRYSSLGLRAFETPILTTTLGSFFPGTARNRILPI